MSSLTVNVKGSFEGDTLDEIARMVTITHAKMSDLIGFAVDMKGMLVKPEGTSSDLKLTSKEECFLTVLTDNGLETRSLHNYTKNGVLLNIERFLVDTSARIYVTHKRKERHSYSTVIAGYMTDAMGNIKKISGLSHGVVTQQHIRFMTDSILNLPITRFELIPLVCSDSIRYDYVINKEQHVQRDTRYFSCDRADTLKIYELSRLLAGFKISNDLKKVSFKLTIDPTINFVIKNPWLLDELGKAEKFTYTDLISLLEYFTELYKLKYMLPKMGFKDKQLDMQQIKLFGLGRFFVYYPKDLNPGRLRDINDLYQKYGLTNLFRDATNTSRHARDHLNRFYIEFNFK